MERNAVLAAVLEQEQTLRVSALDVTAREKAEQPEKTDDRENRLRSVTQEPAGAEELYQRLMQAASLQGQTAAIRQAAEQEQLFRQIRSEAAAAQIREQHPGGISAQTWQSMRISGTAGKQTQQSMAEISRFFERDSRRY